MKMSVPQDIAKQLSKISAHTLGRFLEFSALSVASPQDAEDRILASLALTLSRRSARQ